MKSTETVKIRYFALLRELIGFSEENWPIESGMTASSLYEKIAMRYSLPLDIGDVRVAVNDEFTVMHHILTDGDQIAFIPPVSGG